MTHQAICRRCAEVFVVLESGFENAGMPNRGGRLCPMSSHMVEATDFSKGPPDWCPFVLAHLLIEDGSVRSEY